MSNKDTAAAIESAKRAEPAVPNAITLDTPIVRGEQEITVVQVRKPGSGELRGTQLTDLLHMDVAALITLLPRITSPTLTTHDITQMDPADLVQLGSAVVSFLLPKAMRDQASLAA